MFFLPNWSNFCAVSLNHRVQLPRQERFLSQQYSLTGRQDPSAVCNSRSGAALVSHLCIELITLLSSLASRKNFFFLSFILVSFLPCGSYMGWIGDYKIRLKAYDISNINQRKFVNINFQILRKINRTR